MKIIVLTELSEYFDDTSNFSSYSKTLKNRESPVYIVLDRLAVWRPAKNGSVVTLRSPEQILIVKEDPQEILEILRAGWYGDGV